MTSRANNLFSDSHKNPELPSRVVSAAGDGEVHPRSAPADRGAAHSLDLLFERSCTLADRARSGELPFIDAVDMAYSAADWSGLVGRYGDDVVQLVLADAFGGRRA